MIPLGPLSTRALLGVHVEQVLTAEQCDEVVGGLVDHRWTDARVTDADNAYGSIRPAVRSVLSQRLPIRADGFPLAEITEAIAQANATAWRYRLTGFDQQDFPSVLRYDHDSQDHFRPHLDAGEFAPTRKLSFSVQLSAPEDYRGGDLIIDGATSMISRRKGMMTVFSSVCRHEVTSVYSGRRIAIVGWIHGPSFH